MAVHSLSGHALVWSARLCRAPARTVRSDETVSRFSSVARGPCNETSGGFFLYIGFDLRPNLSVPSLGTLTLQAHWSWAACCIGPPRARRV
jgi:hypothetical protein